MQIVGERKTVMYLVVLSQILNVWPYFYGISKIKHYYIIDHHASVLDNMSRMVEYINTHIIRNNIFNTHL